MDTNPKTGYDVAISGISCRLPSSENMSVFAENLLSGKDMAYIDGKMPEKWGHLTNINKFDADFFGISPKHANLMDPQLRMLLEVTYEAMIDAGIEPASLRGTDTGVFVGMTLSHTLETWIANPENPNSYAVWGCTKNMFANRISYTFDLQGPSYSIQCSSAGGSVALDEAYQSILVGEVDTAVVGGCSMCFKDMANDLYENIVENKDPEDGHFCGGDGIVVMILQKADVAKRIYASILQSQSQLSQTNTGLQYAKVGNQATLLQRLYDDASVDPDTVDYVEVLGTNGNDEIAAMSEAFGAQRENPLLVGSVKSSVGHLDAVSGLVSVAKALVTFEEGMVPATIDCQESAINALSHDNVEVATENIRTDTTRIGVNNLGYGGYHTHTILARSQKSKLVQYMAADKQRLCIYGSNTEEGVRQTLKFLQEHTEDVELHSILNETACSRSGSAQYRGYCVLNDGTKDIHIQQCPSAKRPVWYVFSGMGTQWPKMGRSMMGIDAFCRSIRESSEALQPFGINVYNMIMADDDNDYENALNSFVGIAAIQIALVHVLRELGITPDGILGHSAGETACAFADGALTARETILAAYWRGHCIQESKLPPGSMAAVGMTWEEVKKQCPPGIVAACHNSKDTVTISGPSEQITKFVATLKEKGVFAKEVNSAGVAFHSSHMQLVAPLLTEKLSKCIKAKPRTHHWISTSIPEDKWDSDLAKECSVEYLVNNLTSPVLFQEGLQHIPANAIVIEIAPHDLLQAVLRRSLDKSIFHIGLMKKGHKNNSLYLFNSLGKCYMHGMSLNPLGIFPPVEYPVSRRTPMLSSIIARDHSRSWDVPDLSNFLSGKDGRTCATTFEIDTGTNRKDEYLHGHMISGRPMFPASGYILLAWKALAKFHGLLHTQMAVKLDNIGIHRATMLPKEGILKFEVSLVPQLGHFEVFESMEMVCNGQICRQTEATATEESIPNDSFIEGSPGVVKEPPLTKSEVYKELRLRGYQYKEKFQAVLEADNRGKSGVISWTGDWITFIDAMMQMVLIARPGRHLLLPIQISAVEISPGRHKDKLNVSKENDTATADAIVDARLNTVVAGGVKLSGLGIGLTNSLNTQHVSTQENVFIPYNETVHTTDLELNLHDYARDCAALASKFTQVAAKALSPETVNELQLEKVLAGVDESTIGTATIETETYTKYYSCYFIRLLEMLCSLPIDKNYEENLKMLLKSFDSDIHQDALLSALHSHKVLKSCFDVVLENQPGVKQLEVLEIVGQRESVYNDCVECLKGSTSLQLDYTLCGSKSPVEGTSMLNWDLLSASPQDVGPYHVIILDNILSSQNSIEDVLANISALLADDGFLFVTEPTDNLQVGFTAMLPDYMCEVKENRKTMPKHWLAFDAWLKIFDECGLQSVAMKEDGSLSSTFLLRKHDKSKLLEDQMIVDVSDLSCNWVSELKQKHALCQQKPKAGNLWIVSEKQPMSGVLGMVRCLSKEPGGSRIRCLFLEDSCDVSVKHLKDSQLFKELVEKDLVMNVYKNDQWGSYRHLPVSNDEKLHSTETACVELNVHSTRPVWVTSCQNPSSPENRDRVLCYPKFCFIGNTEVSILNKTHTNNVQNDKDINRAIEIGTQFSGVDSTGRRVMGVVSYHGMSTQVHVDKQHLWKIPSQWRLAEACAVPLAYCIAYYALNICTQLQKTQSILICGSNTPSQAATTLALHTGSRVFVAVETKKAKQMFQQYHGHKLKAKQVLVARDGFFFADVLQQTNGKGVDIVFDSDGGRCFENAVYSLQTGGSFLQLADGSSTPANKYECLMQRKASYCPINMDHLDKDTEERLSMLVQIGIDDKVVKTFDLRVVDCDEIHDLGRKYDTSTERLAVKVAEELVVGPAELEAVQKIVFKPEKSYIIVGGLGGFGLELVEWMVERGATKLVLSSRSGVTTGYQTRKIRLWKKKNAIVKVSNKDVTTLEGTRELVSEAERLGPLGGVFNLAMVLRDGLIEAQTEESFRQVCGPKVAGTSNLDKVTRALASSSLDWFVVFSSISSGLGNIGQTNYGFANSAMEQICKHREQDGLPGIAIQWGAVGDVGVVTEKFGDVAVGGTMPQKMASCISTLEMFMLKSKPVVTSYVPESSLTSGIGSDQQQSDKDKDLFKTICNIIGVSPTSSLKPQAKMVDMGLDSLMVIEVRQTMEKYADKLLTNDQVRELTIGEIKKLSSHQKREVVADDPAVSNSSKETPHADKEVLKPWPEGQTIASLNDVHGNGVHVYIVFEQDELRAIQSLVAQLECPVYGVIATDHAPTISVKSLAGYLVQKLFVHTNNNPVPLVLVGHKFGCPVAIEIAIQLQELQPVKHIICLEGSHHFIPTSNVDHLHHDVLAEKDYVDQENEALFAFVGQYKDIDDEIIDALDCSDELTKVKVANVIDILMDSENDASLHTSSRSNLERQLYAYVQKYLISGAYVPEDTYKGQITLIRGRQRSSDVKIAGDYGLSKVCNGGVAVHILNFEHADFLSSVQEKIAPILSATITKVTDVPE